MGVIFGDTDKNKKIAIGTMFFKTKQSVDEARVDNHYNENDQRVLDVELVLAEGMLQNVTRQGFDFLMPNRFSFKEKLKNKDGEEVNVSLQVSTKRESMEIILGEKEGRGLQEFAFMKEAARNQKIPSKEVFFVLNEKDLENKEEVITSRITDVLRKLPLPIKKDWLKDIVEICEVNQCLKINPEDKREVFWMELPTEAALEKAIVSAYKKELWKEYHNQIPRLDTVANGVFLIEKFNLKDWMNFIKKFGMDKFKGYTPLHQEGIVSIVELIGSEDALKAIKKYGVSTWHTVEMKSFFMRIREQDTIPKRDLPRVQERKREILSQLEDAPDDKKLVQELKEVELQEEMMLKRIEDANLYTIEDQIELIKKILKVAHSDEDSQKNNNALMKEGVENVDRILKYMKKENIKRKKLTRKGLKAILLELTYENVRHPRIATVCSRAKVSQREFEEYQDLWDRYEKERKTSPTRIPTFSGTIGNLKWEMLEFDDPNALVVGNETHCCQHPLGAGGACVTYMMSHPETSTAFKVSKINGNGRALAQSFVWVDVENDILVFDNIEVDGGMLKDEILECYKQYVSQVDEHKVFKFEGGYRIGTGFSDMNLKGFRVAEGNFKANIPSDLGYTDARRQVIINP